MKVNIVPKLMREANLHFCMWMMYNKPTDAKISSTVLFDNLIFEIFIAGESGKKRHITFADNCITHIVIISSIKTNLAVST